MTSKFLHDLLPLSLWPHRPQLSCLALSPATLAPSCISFNRKQDSFRLLDLCTLPMALGTISFTLWGALHALGPGSWHAPYRLRCEGCFTQCGTNSGFNSAFCISFLLDHSLHGSIFGILPTWSAQGMNIKVVTWSPSVWSHNYCQHLCDHFSFQRIVDLRYLTINNSHLGGH